MAPRTIYANLPDGLQHFTLWDDSLSDMGKLGIIPCTATGTTAFVLTPVANAFAPTPAYANNNQFSFAASSTSTGPVTANINGLGARNVYKADGVTQATTGDITSGRFYGLIYNAALNAAAGGFYLQEAFSGSASDITGLAPSATIDTTNATNISSGTLAAARLPSVVLQKLTANTTYYVRTDGNDSNTGLVNSAGGAWLTWQNAVNVLSSQVDLGGFLATVQAGNATDTFTAGFTATNPFVGGGNTGGVAFVGSPSIVITAATNASPSVITAIHNYVNGDHVIISGAIGNTAINGAFKVANANIGANTFTLTNENTAAAINGNGVYTASSASVQATSKIVIAAAGGAGTATATPMTVQYGAVVNAVSGFKFSSANAQLIVSIDGGHINVGKNQYDAAGSGQQQLWATRGGRLRIFDYYSISGFGAGNSQFMQSSHGGNIRQESSIGTAIANLTYDITNTGFLYALNGEIVTTVSPGGTPFNANGFTVTARKWLATELGIIQVEGSGPPSDSVVPGTVNGLFCTNNVAGIPASGPSIAYSLTAPNAVQVFSGTAGIQLVKNDNTLTLWTIPNTQIGPGTLSLPTLGGTLAASAFGQLPATATNDSASAGNVGEFISSTIASGSAVVLTTATPVNITSISLTAGDWDVSANVSFIGGGTTQVNLLWVSISNTTGALDGTPGRSQQDYRANQTIFAVATFENEQVAPTRISLASTTTIFLVASASFTVSTCSAYGIIRARRMR